MTREDREIKLREDWKKFQEWQKEQEKREQTEEEAEQEPEEEGNFFDTWPENLRILFKEVDVCNIIYDYFVHKLKDIKIDNEKIPEPDEIGSLCRTYAYRSFDTGLLTGYAFSHYLDKPLKKFKEEAERVSRYQLKELKEEIEQWNKDCFI